MFETISEVPYCIEMECMSSAGTEVGGGGVGGGERERRLNSRKMEANVLSDKHLAGQWSVLGRDGFISVGLVPQIQSHESVVPGPPPSLRAGQVYVT